MNYLVLALGAYLFDSFCYFNLNVCGVVNHYKTVNYRLSRKTLIILILEKAEFVTFEQKQSRRELNLY